MMEWWGYVDMDWNVRIVTIYEELPYKEDFKRLISRFKAKTEDEAIRKATAEIAVESLQRMKR